MADVQRQAIYSVLDEVMAVLRDDRPFEKENLNIGVIRSIGKYKPSGLGLEYSFTNKNIPEANIKIETEDDPFDYSDDRSGVKIVPSRFELYFYVSVVGITPSMLKKHLDLADYWIDGDGEKHQGNDMGSGLPPTPALHRYRYRANPTSNSRFPVDVELSYGDGRGETTASTPPSLWIVRFNRVYPYLTPEMRKQRREEERFKKREKYGYMNLCTGGVCPESGYWEGWTKESGPTDILRVEKGQKFDAVRTVPLTTDRSSCPMVPGQWMWLCSLEEARGFQWMGLTLNG
ncbi:hypothetical protein [Paraburkholderia sp. Ac-20347]|uniref:hypothetical protein n=1 Tax=Paraburkholderia sp. Ac-20347 TaxID=2703892 RepID=UPI00197E97C3|nr:hypothetical protein [Paraburkholderia sp. Ac-20347]MBN3811040.1 hypothetical protein [Paraburkholderia sp. Ac-20347]